MSTQNEVMDVRSFQPDDLWRDFLPYCGKREPNDALADAFAVANASVLDFSAREMRSAAVMLVLRDRLLFGAAHYGSGPSHNARS